MIFPRQSAGTTATAMAPRQPPKTQVKTTPRKCALLGCPRGLPSLTPFFAGPRLGQQRLQRIAVTMHSAAIFRLMSGGKVVIPVVKRADGFWARALGLMGRRDLPAGHGLWLEPCNAIHTGFMRFPLDVVYLDGQHRVVRVALNVRPWRMSFGGRGASSAIEVQAGWLDAGSLPPGAPVEFVSLSSAAQ